MFRSLRNPVYRVFWIGSFVSQLGSWVQMIARPWLVYEITHSAAALGFIGFLNAIPLLFLSLFGGVLADRADRRKLIAVTQTLYMVLAFTLALLVWTHAVRVWHVAALSLLGGMVTACDLPARQAMVSDMVGNEDLLNAIALNSTSFNLARILGPTVAGLLVQYLGLASCFFIDGLSFLAIIFPMLGLRFPQTPPHREGSLWESMREGLAYIASQPRLMAFMSVVTLASLFALPYGTLMPAFAREVFGTDAAGMGRLFAASGVGALIGALFLARIGGSDRIPSVVVGAAFGLCASLIAYSYTRTFGLAMVGLGFIGLTATTQNAATNTLVQAMVPDRLRGRVMSAYMMIFQGAMPFGNLQAGMVAERWGAPFAVRFGGGIFFLYLLALSFRLKYLPPISESDPPGEAETRDFALAEGGK